LQVFTCRNSKGAKNDKGDAFRDRPSRCHNCDCGICREYRAKEIEKARAKAVKKKATFARKKATKRAGGTAAPESAEDRLARLEKREEPKKWLVQFLYGNV
jgi:hypothetical protein